MKIFWILVATSCLVSCFAIPVEFQQKITDNERRQNIQASQNLDRDESMNREDRYQQSQISNQPIRQEYRRFGNDPKPLSSDTGNMASGYSNSERKTVQNQPSPLNTFTDRNEVDKFQSSDDSRFQKSNQQQQDTKSVSRFPYDPMSQIQSTFLNQDSFVPGRENIGNQLSFTSIRDQEGSSRGSPSSFGDRSDGMYRESFGSNFPKGQEQININDGSLLQNRFQSGEDLRFQTPQNFYRTDADNRGVVLGQQQQQQQQIFPQQGSFLKQEQIPSTQKSQGHINQYQIENSPVSSSPFEKDGLFHQGQVDFDSRRISSTNNQLIPGRSASGDQDKILSPNAIFPRNQPSEKSQDRQVGDLNNLRLRDGEQVQIDGVNFVKMQDGLFQTVEQNQPGQVGSKFPQSSSPVIVSGMKGSPAGPALVYQTGIAAAPHALVLGKDMGVLNNKASISQHVQTPYIQYTYTHPL